MERYNCYRYYKINKRGFDEVSDFIKDNFDSNLYFVVQHNKVYPASMNDDGAFRNLDYTGFMGIRGEEEIYEVEKVNEKKYRVISSSTEFYATHIHKNVEDAMLEAYTLMLEDLKELEEKYDEFTRQLVGIGHFVSIDREKIKKTHLSNKITLQIIKNWVDKRKNNKNETGKRHDN